MVVVEHRRCPHSPTRCKFSIEKTLTQCEIVTLHRMTHLILFLQIGERNLRWSAYEEEKEKKKEKRKEEKKEKKKEKKREDLATLVLPPPPEFT